jgi:hypothetical protein
MPTVLNQVNPNSIGSKPVMKTPIIPASNLKQLGPQGMKDKLKANMLDNSRTEKRPPSKQPEKTKDDDDDYSDADGFE